MLTLYNTLARAAQEFTPLDARNVRMYVCGPTVYDRAHLGNARSVVVYDVLFRLLRHLYGAEHVTYVRNITDVDDKINAAAKAAGEPISALTQRVTQWFHEDMGALNVLPPTREPRATAHIAQMVAMIEALIARGHAYAAEGHVLFSVSSYAGYGQLSGRVLEDLQAGARVQVESYKRRPGDFVLWKPADAGDDASSVFDSPWGPGRPGWHIECSAMSREYLGAAFDIHGGGADLMFPHHENEIAQSRCAEPGAEFARAWVHNGFLTVNGEKMSKSLGNFITVQDLLGAGVKGEVIRYALLSATYREPLNWTDKLLDDAKKAMDYFYGTLYRLGDAAADAQGEPGALLDDLDTPGVMAAMHASAAQINSGADAAAQAGRLRFFGNMLGVLQMPPEQWVKGGGGAQEADVDAAIAARIAAKKAKNWAEADRIRKELAERGIMLEDRPDGSTDWRRA